VKNLVFGLMLLIAGALGLIFNRTIARGADFQREMFPFLGTRWWFGFQRVLGVVISLLCISFGVMLLSGMILG